jgi:acyl dehydratase
MYSESVVEEKRLSASRPGQGIITLKHTATNQDGVIVATATRTVMVWCVGAQP